MSVRRLLQKAMAHGPIVLRCHTVGVGDRVALSDRSRWRRTGRVVRIVALVEWDNGDGPIEAMSLDEIERG